MPRRATLQDKLRSEPETNAKPTKAKVKAAPVAATSPDKQALRNGGRGRLVAVHVSEPAYKQLRLMAAHADKRHNEILREALNEWFADNGGERLA